MRNLLLNGVFKIMRSLDLLTPEQRYAIAQRYLDLAIASLAATATRKQQIAEAIKIGKSFKHRESDFKGL